MSWINESSLSWHTILMMRLLKCGRIPKHIAFIMDGNRRYARKANVEKIQGHSKGFDKLSEVLRWCLDLGVKEVTVYAFSIENFKRTQEEVDSLMDLAREKFHRLLLEKEKLKKHGVKIRIIGNMSYIPEDIVKLMADAEFITRNNEQALLNVAFSYTAQDEITAACNAALKGLNDGHIDEIDVSVGLLSRCLYTNGSPFPEMIIRTSGETRLSDYLLWQGCASYLHFTGALWPELGARDFLWAVFKYQRVADEIDALSAEIHANPMSYRQKSFVESVKNKSWIELSSVE